MAVWDGVAKVGRDLVGCVSQLDTHLNPIRSLVKWRRRPSRPRDLQYLFLAVCAIVSLGVMRYGWYIKLGLVIIYTAAIAVPLSSQFVLPATPIFAWLIVFSSSRFIPPEDRPKVWVTVLPTLETVLYGANISEILTVFTHPLLDVLAWIPYGIVHFTVPFLIAALTWVYGPVNPNPTSLNPSVPPPTVPLKIGRIRANSRASQASRESKERERQSGDSLVRTLMQWWTGSRPDSYSALAFWARVFGYMNLTGVLIQIFVPCAPPWYELLYGLTPAEYTTPGSAAGLARIDAIFHSSGYAHAFGNSPMVFGAFPSLHAGCATLEALFLTHFFPYPLGRSLPGAPVSLFKETYGRAVYWIYVLWLCWCTMYLSHHYMVDLVAGACLATASFYLFLPDSLRRPEIIPSKADLLSTGTSYTALDGSNGANAPSRPPTLSRTKSGI